ncbi:PilW family protein [Acinetobacter indicus]|uniref:PilW family protein n=1 Tax=Acinetobacter indicus TaxID=756892 RepID=UPI000CEC2A7C|nr:PilW family protein [Acinetobacter indicus]
MKQQGFTLVELMISITLGLIVVATAIMLFLSGQRNLALQNAAGTVQEDQNFGLSYIARQIRMANLNSPSAQVNNTLALSGIVFSKDNLNSLVSVPTDFNSKFITKANITSSNIQSRIGTAVFTDAQSDQLVIQYKPAESGGYDCEGNEITNTNAYIVERYFVRTDSNNESHETTDELKKSLACAASRYSANLTIATNLDSTGSGIYGSGQIILKRVDLFKVRLLVDDSTSTVIKRKYLTLAEYESITTNRPRVISIQLGLISRAAQPTNDAVIPDNQVFKIFNLDAQVKSDQPRKYIRAPIMQTITLRNALGDR